MDDGRGNPGAFGETFVITPIPIFLLSCMIALIVAIVIIFLFWGHYNRKQTVQGYLVPDKGLIKVYAPARGVVTRRGVNAGEVVHKGNVLFVVSTRHSSVGAADVDSSLISDAQTAKLTLLSQITEASKLEAAQTDEIKAEAVAFKKELSAIHKQIKIETHQLDVIKENLNRLKPLLKSRLIASSDYQKQYEQVLSQQSTVQGLRASALDLQRQIDSAPSKIAQAKLNVMNQIAEYRKSIAQINQQLTQYRAGRDFVIRATSDGTVAGLVAQVGQQVEPNRPLMTMLPKGAVLTARLLVPASAIGFIHRGEKVKFRYSAFPYQRFGLYGGHIKWVSKAVFLPADLSVPVPLQEPVYLATAALDRRSIHAYGKTIPLQAGMLLSADIIIDRESLIDWILAPLYSIRGRI